MKRFFLILMLLAASIAFAAKPQNIAIPIGHSTTLAMPGTVASVRVDDPSKISVTQEGRRLTIVGVAQGSTDAVVATAEGEVRIHIYVAVDKYALPY